LAIVYGLTNHKAKALIRRKELIKCPQGKQDGTSEEIGSCPKIAGFLVLLKEMAVNTGETNWRIFSKNFLAGLAWGLGATLGVVLVLSLLGYLLRLLGGLPIVGGFFARLIEATEEALRSRRI